MSAVYEYKFVRLDDSKPGLLGILKVAVFHEPAVYQQAVHDHAAQGWRLVQIFAPPTPYPSGSPAFYELVFERPIADAEPKSGA